MSISKHYISVNNLDVEVVRKPIKNLHLAVYPPNGRIRIAVPQHFDDDSVRLTIIKKISWIKKHQEKYRNQPRQSARAMVSGESHYFMGRRYLLEVNERTGAHEVEIKGIKKLALYVNPGTTMQNRSLALNEWYREQLKSRLPKLIEKYEKLMGVKVKDWGIKRMRTRWGTCNIRAKRIWINLELAKKPIECLEYIVVHEMCHLLERLHNDKFKAYLDKYYPKWRMQKKLLNSMPLEHEDWGE